MAEVSVSECQQTARASENNPLHYRPKTVAFPVRHEHTQDLAELVQALQQTANGKRHLVFLHGEQRIGKTAMLDTFLAKIHHPELSVLRTRCVKMEGSTEPFLPVLEALERRCRESEGSLLLEYLNLLAPSWLHQMLNVLSPDQLALLPPKEVQVNTCLMLREAADLFETLSCNATFILILDNAHWSDEFTLDLLNFLMFRCSAAKLLIIVSYRSCEDGPGTRRIAEMREELSQRGLCQELAMQKLRG